MGRAMKDSGVEWIGEIPEDWGIIRFKHLNVGMNTGEGIDKEYWSNNENDMVFYTAGLLPIYTTYQDFPVWKYTCENDLLLARNGTPYVYLPVCNACYTDHIIRVTLKKDANRRFVRYGLQQSISSVVINQVSIATWSASLWNEQVLPFPPLSAQQKIADFLDYKCSEIDAVLNKTRASIEEYKHLKQVVIARAVTKGVRGERAMKESGIEWLKEIPSSWTVIPSKFLFRNSDECRLLDDEPLTASQKHGIVTQAQYMELENAKVVFASKGLECWKHVKPNDFIISLRSFQGGLEMSEITGCITWHYIVLRPCKHIYPHYFKWLFKSSLYINALQSTCNFIRDGQDLRYSNFVQVPLFTPPLGEQQEIADYLDEKSAEMDALIAKGEQLLTELENYKKSLVYEYVTGKKEVQ